MDDEDYLPGFELPIEPAPLTRAERFTFGLIVLVVVAQLGLGIAVLLTAAQAEDPALLQRGDDTTEQEADEVEE